MADWHRGQYRPKRSNTTKGMNGCLADALVMIIMLPVLLIIDLIESIKRR